MRSRFLGAVVSAVACATAFAHDVSAAADQACALVIHIDGFRNEKGVAGGTLFTSASGWPEDNEKAFRLTHSAIKDKQAVLRFSQLPAGRYAVAVIHDENSNKKLDRSFLRVPKEGFGFANNPRIGLSAPPFDAAAVDVSCPQTEITIHLIYK